MTTFDRKFWARSAVATVMVSAGVFATMKLASAVPGGETRPHLSFAGTLTNTTGPQTLTFTFRKGMAMVCTATTMPVTPGTGGQFSVEVPIDRCPATLFDGADVTVEVSVGGMVVAPARPINPVPYARYADRVGTPDCPTGYERDPSASGIVLCRRALAGGAFDEVVRVGTGATAFWVDRYEVSVWTNPAAGDSVRAPEGYPGLRTNGQWLARDSRRALVARSVSGQAPSTSVTWFQANELCRAAGKRLPTDDEWLSAAEGTVDDAATCQTSGSGPRPSTASNSCVSTWGAQDMIGNLWEWTAVWAAGVGRGGPATTPGAIESTETAGGQPTWPGVRTVAGWPTGGLYNGDAIYNVNSTAAVANFGGDTRLGIPAATVRGGGWENGTGAGIFALDLRNAPARTEGVIGFRCVISR